MKNTHKLANLIAEMIPVEIQKISNVDFHSMDDLGDAYEGISEEMSKLIYRNISPELKVVSGQITVNGVVVRAQIDRMLVFGEGVEMGINTRNYQYDISQVLVVIESKKTLNKKEIEFTIRHFSKISSAYRGLPIKEKASGKKKSLIYDTAKSTCDKKCLQDNYKAIMESFTKDHDRPLLVCLSFSGYKTLGGLSECYVKSVSDHVDGGTTFWDLPNFILCGDMCLIRDGFSSTTHRSENSPGLGVQAAKVNGIDFLVLAIWKKIIRAGLTDDVYKYSPSLLRKAKTICWFPSKVFEKPDAEPFSTVVDLINNEGDEFFERPGISPVLVNESFFLFFMGSMHFSGSTKGRIRGALDDFRQQLGMEAYKEVLKAYAVIPNLFDDNFLMLGVGGGFHFLRSSNKEVYFSCSLETLFDFCVENKLSGKVDSIPIMVVDEGLSSARTIFGHCEGWVEDDGSYRITKLLGKKTEIHVHAQSYKDHFNQKLAVEE